MANVESANCNCEYPCGCLVFEGQHYNNYGELIDFLVHQRESLKLQIKRNQPKIGRIAKV